MYLTRDIFHSQLLKMKSGDAIHVDDRDFQEIFPDPGFLSNAPSPTEQVDHCCSRFNLTHQHIVETQRHVFRKL